MQPEGKGKGRGKGKGKRKGKGPFYSEPYVTCYFCNHIAFMDIHQFQFLQTLRTKKTVETGDFIPKSIQNRLPPCEGCGKLDGFVFGAHDFAKDIDELKRLKALRHQMELKAVQVIVRYYRKYLQKKHKRAMAGAKLTKRFLRYQAAVRIGSVARGRLARRRYVTEKHLAFIKDSHPLLIRHSLKIVPGQPRVFWYRRPVELELVFSNYLVLVEKTGQQPPRVVVERNIAILAQRILQRQNELVIFVQKRWRGFISRRIVRFYRTETFRLFSREVSKVLRIQRLYRGHHARMYILPRMLADRLNAVLMKSYQVESHQRKLKVLRQKAKEGLQVAYLKEKAVASTAKLLSKLPYQFDSDAPPPSVKQLAASKGGSLGKPGSAVAGNAQDAALHLSMYGDDIAFNRSRTALAVNQDITATKFAVGEEDIHRREFIIGRLAEKGPAGYGSRDQLPSLEAMFAPRASNRNRKDSSRSHYMRQYFSEDLEGLKNRAMERILNPSEEDCIHEKHRHEKKKSAVYSEIHSFNKLKALEIEAANKARAKQKPARRRSSQYTYPEHVTFNSNDWLYAHDDKVC